jgi:hypothetical protein
MLCPTIFTVSSDYKMGANDQVVNNSFTPELWYTTILALTADAITNTHYNEGYKPQKELARWEFIPWLCSLPQSSLLMQPA